VPASLLEEFQRAPQKTATRFQLTMDAARRAAWNRTLQSGAAPLVVHDRALLGSRAFAAWNYVCGSLTRAEYDTCLATEGDAPLYDTLASAASALRQPVLVVLFATPVAVCRERVASRDDSDRATPLRYLAGLSLMHALLLEHALRQQREAGGSALLRVVCGSGDEPQASSRCLCATLGRTATPRTYITAERHATALALSEAEAARMGELGLPGKRKWREHEWLAAPFAAH